MQLTRSLKFKLSLGIIAVMLPLVAFTFYNNTNAINTVQEKVSETYSNTLRIFIERVDDTLLEVNQYLYKMENQDADIGVIQSYPYLSDEYILTKIRIQQKMIRDIGFYNMMDTIFLYSEKDIIHASTSSEMVSVDIIRRNIELLIDLEKTQEKDKWHLLYDERADGGYFLARIHKMNTGLYGGAFVKIVDIAKPLDILWNQGNIGETVIYSRLGEEVNKPLTPTTRIFARNTIQASTSITTHTAKEGKTGDRYLIMNQSSEVADIVYTIMIPEKTMLNNIPFLQKATYFLPLGIAVILVFFLLFLNEIVLKPLGELMRGMRKISMGVLDARLKENKTTEFYFLAHSFNTMAQELKNLKIDVYEEQLRVQQAEFKHLQAQISPHFYMNSLNIIYNFAALGDHESVKKMSLHLADYFRFIMRTNRNQITLAEELQHIHNYIDIQKIRFPGKLEYEVQAADEFMKIELPALTIQPFVENAIIHGFKNRRQLFRIEIIIEHDPAEGMIRLRIRDNGIGFSEEVLAALNEDAPLSQAETSRLGIQNVIHRLRLHYHNACAVRFANREEGGAEITIELPFETPQTLTEGREEDGHV